jgi:hypothetical protein
VNCRLGTPFKSGFYDLQDSSHLAGVTIAYPFRQMVPELAEDVEQGWLALCPIPAHLISAWPKRRAYLHKGFLDAQDRVDVHCGS